MKERDDIMYMEETLTPPSLSLTSSGRGDGGLNGSTTPFDSLLSWSFLLPSLVGVALSSPNWGGGGSIIWSGVCISSASLTGLGGGRGPLVSVVASSSSDLLNTEVWLCRKEGVSGVFGLFSPLWVSLWGGDESESKLRATGFKFPEDLAPEAPPMGEAKSAPAVIAGAARLRSLDHVTILVLISEGLRILPPKGGRETSSYREWSSDIP